jgi:hypothetical protein
MRGMAGRRAAADEGLPKALYGVRDASDDRMPPAGRYSNTEKKNGGDPRSTRSTHSKAWPAKKKTRFIDYRSHHLHTHNLTLKGQIIIIKIKISTNREVCSDWKSKSAIVKRTPTKWKYKPWVNHHPAEKLEFT